MPKRKITESIELDSQLLDTTAWPTVNITSLKDEDLKTFQNRKEAIEMYLKDKPHSEIKKKTGIDRKELNIFFKNCITEHEDGRMYGFRALIPRITIAKYTRKELPNSTKDKTHDNFTGAFTLLLNTYPDLKEEIDRLYFNKKNKAITDRNTRIRYIHKKFINKCRELKLKPPYDYPFNTRELGRRSLYKYIEDLEKRNMVAAASRYSEEAGKLAENSGYVDDNFSPNKLQPFERVQFDGHKINTSIAITFDTPSGDQITKVMDRLWLLVTIDVSTNAVLGYYLSTNKEYTASDVLHCFENSIVPWEPLDLEIPGLKYPENAGLPSGKIKEAEWALWDELYYDNAKSHFSNMVIKRTKQIIGCHINAGKSKSPTKRPLIERFFGLLEENGFNRMPNTTGSNPKDPRRKNPEEQAIKYHITLKEIEDLLDVLIAEYNAEPTEGNSFLSPLESMQQKLLLNDPHTRKLLPEERDKVAFLCIETIRTVKGSIKKGRRPYIQYENVRYTNELLLRSPGLIGKKLDLVIDIDDIRFLKAYLPDGSELGKLVASGYWGKTKHSLAIRKAIYQLKNRKLIHFTNKDDPIQIYDNYLREKAITHKAYRAKLAEFEKTTVEMDNSKIPNKEIEEVVENNTSNVQYIPDVKEVPKEKNEVQPEEKQKSISKYHRENKKFRKTIIY